MSNVIYTSSSQSEVEQALRSLPAILEGTHPDPWGISDSMRNRVAFAFLDIVSDAFQQKGRGLTGSDGIQWDRLSPEYLAYSRPIAGRSRPLAGKKAPGNKDGLLSDSELSKWRKTYSYHLKRLAGKYLIQEAKSRSAALAWIALKKQGAQTKLASPNFGERVVGQDYQIHVISGTLRRTLQPGQLTPRIDGGADYFTPDAEQVKEDQGSIMVVGTRLNHASALHKRRPFWPEEDNNLPEEWNDELGDALHSGIVMFVKLVERGEI